MYEEPDPYSDTRARILLVIYASIPRTLITTISALEILIHLLCRHLLVEQGAGEIGSVRCHINNTTWFEWRIRLSFPVKHARLCRANVTTALTAKGISGDLTYFFFLYSLPK